MNYAANDKLSQDTGFRLVQINIRFGSIQIFCSYYKNKSLPRVGRSEINPYQSTQDSSVV